MKRLLLSFALVVSTANLLAQEWPVATTECKPGTRWWWLGSAVNEKDLHWNMQEYAKAGLGTLEITPIYGVQGNSKNELSFLSAPWMKALNFVEDEGRRDGLEIDMNTGTGWPFGGPDVPIVEAASKVLFYKWTYNRRMKKLNVAVPDAKESSYSKLSRLMAYPINGNRWKDRPVDLTTSVNDSMLYWKAPKGDWQIIAVYAARTRQKVKRAAPGGEGYVIDHFDSAAVAHYLQRFDKAFSASGVPYPHTFFNDSYEVYNADWTPRLFEEFQKRRGYKLEEHLPELIGDTIDVDNKVLSDYRETLSELLIHNFTEQWTTWAHSHGSITRNQAHGSPSNLIDTYAAVDIPEIEGFGLSKFNIKGLRQDSDIYTRKNFSDLSMLKYASSAAHITGKKLTSSETFTWLTEHFRTSLSQCKPDMDLMFVSGVNRMLFHGTCYSPEKDSWPGWKFYASIDMSPTNSIWHDAPYFFKYIERCQSFLQWGQPDNDFIVYLPIHDMWGQRIGKGKNNLLMMFDIHSMNEKSPQFINTILKIDSMGFDCDYISDKYLLTTSFVNGMLQTASGIRYKGLIIPANRMMPKNVKAHIEALRSLGAKIIYGCDATAMDDAAKPEAMKSLYHLKAIRRRNDKGYHYFISNLTSNDISSSIPLAVKFKNAMFFNPLNGERFATHIDKDGNILFQLKSGESLILETFDEQTPLPLEKETLTKENIHKLNKGWSLSFVESHPKVDKVFNIDTLRTWETLDDDSVKETMGTGAYYCYFNISQKEMSLSKKWMIDLGDVRESARVWINGKYLGCAWCAPFSLDCRDAIHIGKNNIRIEVTNLPANRIAAMDRKGIKWRKFNEINVVDLNYKNTSYGSWQPVKSGLNSHVNLISYSY